MGGASEQDSSLAMLQEILRQRICDVCIDRKVDGSCGLTDPAECALFDRFPRIVHAVSRVESDNLDDYVQSIREEVCADCANQYSDGSCQVREQVRCVLDRYLLLIVGAIEEAKGVTLKQGRPLQH